MLECHQMSQPLPFGSDVLPRLVIAAPHSGSGKTTLSIGLIAALAREMRVSAHKVGPDYIDPGFHTLASGRPSRNLDPVLCGPSRMVPLLLHGARTPEPADIAIIEGVMGLFDGRLGTEGAGSTAEVAELTDSPVLLCVDCSGAARSIGALVHGLSTWQPTVKIAGVVLNQVASPRQAAEITAAVEPSVPVVGTIYRDPDLAVPSRHLGLTAAAEFDQAKQVIDTLADRIAEQVDLGQVLAIAQRAAPLASASWNPADEVRPASAARPVVAVAGGPVFTFCYTETLELLQAARCELLHFDPLQTSKLPEAVAGLYLGGGFPELHLAGLAENVTLRNQLRELVAAGVPTVAECAGQLVLAERLDGEAMVGAIPATAGMAPKLRLGYREATAPSDTLLAVQGERVWGHEFHRTRTRFNQEVTPAWVWDDHPQGISATPQQQPSLHSSYLHVHWAGYPSLAQRFADAVHHHYRQQVVA